MCIYSERRVHVERLCVGSYLPLSDWPWLPSIFLMCMYVSRYVNTARTIHDATLYRRLVRRRKGDCELEGRGITCSSDENVFVQRGSFIFKWTVDFILYLAHLSFLKAHLPNGSCGALSIYIGYKERLPVLGSFNAVRKREHFHPRARMDRNIVTRSIALFFCWLLIHDKAQSSASQAKHLNIERSPPTCPLGWSVTIVSYFRN